MLCGAAGGGRAIKTIVASGSRPGPETPLNQRGRKAKEILTGSLPSLALVGLSVVLTFGPIVPCVARVLVSYFKFSGFG